MQIEEVNFLFPFISETELATGGTNFKILYENHEVGVFVSLLKAIEAAFGLYFIFNVSYPKKVELTLEFLQQYCLKYNPCQGTKTSKKSTKTKVINLIKKFAKNS